MNAGSGIAATQRHDRPIKTTLLLPSEVAKRLNVADSWVYRAARDGIIPCVRVGRWVRFEEAAIETWIADGGGVN